MKKEDALLRGLVYNDEVSVCVADTTQLINEAIRIHDLSALSRGRAVQPGMWRVLMKFSRCAKGDAF